MPGFICTYWQIVVYTDLLTNDIIIKESMNKGILFTSLLILSASLSYGNTSLQLSSESKREIIVSAVKGGISGLATFALGYCLAHEFKKFPFLSQHPITYIVWASVGAGIMAIWRYNHVAESHFVFAKDGLMSIPKDSLLNLVTHTELNAVLAQLKNYFFKERFPLSASFRRLEELYACLQEYSNSLQEVMVSGRNDLKQESQELLVLIEMYQDTIQNVMRIVKDDPNFITECNAQTMVAMQQAQMMAAQAAQSNAIASWVHAFKPVSNQTQIVVL